MCEFTGLDFEMAIYEHYFEVGGCVWGGDGAVFEVWGVGWGAENEVQGVKRGRA